MGLKKIDNVKINTIHHMNLRILVSIYSIMIGILMILMWLVLILTNQVPEIYTAPLNIGYHLLAEFLTATFLLFGGFGLYTKKEWSFHLFLISMGMLLYTVIVSAGYYANDGDLIMVGMFTALQLFTILFIGIALFKYKDFKN